MNGSHIWLVQCLCMCFSFFYRFTNWAVYLCAADGKFIYDNCVNSFYLLMDFTLSAGIFLEDMVLTFMGCVRWPVRCFFTCCRLYTLILFSFLRNALGKNPSIKFESQLTHTKHKKRTRCKEEDKLSRFKSHTHKMGKMCFVCCCCCWFCLCV